jgi:hypothetical protein
VLLGYLDAVAGNQQREKSASGGWRMTRWRTKRESREVFWTAEAVEGEWQDTTPDSLKLTSLHPELIPLFSSQTVHEEPNCRPAGHCCLCSIQ